MYKDIQKADIILTFNRDSKLSRAIANITDSGYSHTMIYIGNGFVLESSVGGVQISPLKKYTEEKYNIAILRASISKADKEVVVEKSLELLGKKYGYLQLFWYLFIRLIGQSENPRWQLDIQPRKMVCSEAVAVAFGEAGVDVKKGFQDSGIEPVDFLESPWFKKVYETS